MAGMIEFDTLHGRVFSMWEENGIQYRSNILMWVGAKIPLHVHSYNHAAKIKGKMLMTVNSEEVVVQHGSEVIIPAGQWHTFELLEPFNEIGEVLCYWRSE